MCLESFIIIFGSSGPASSVCVAAIAVGVCFVMVHLNIFSAMGSPDCLQRSVEERTFSFTHSGFSPHFAAVVTANYYLCVHLHGGERIRTLPHHTH